MWLNPNPLGLALNLFELNELWFVSFGADTMMACLKQDNKIQVPLALLALQHVVYCLSNCPPFHLILDTFPLVYHIVKLSPQSNYSKSQVIWSQ